MIVLPCGAALANLAVDAVGQHAVHHFPGIVVAAVERPGVVRLDHAADLRAEVLAGSASAAGADRARGPGAIDEAVLDLSASSAASTPRRRRIHRSAVSVTTTLSSSGEAASAGD